MKPSAYDSGLGAWSAWHDPDTPLKIGVSSCLLGEEVRYDGGHKRSDFVVDGLGPCFEFVRVCPEVEVGMGVPRPTIRVEEENGALRLVAPDTGEDFTKRMRAYSGKCVRTLMREGLDGYVLKKGSPSCGPFRVPIHTDGQHARRNGEGFFASEIRARWPHLPVEDEGRLGDNAIRENFVEQVFVRNRWRSLVASGLTRARLQAFHAAHELLLRAHNEAGCRRAGRLLGSTVRTTDQELFDAYEAELHRTMQTRSRPARHTKVLQHAMGYLKKALTPSEKSDIGIAIEDYRAGMLPLIIPMTLLRHNIRKHEVAYLLGQLYFDPHPKELMLRNHA